MPKSAPSRAEYSPPFQGGVDAPPRNIPVPLKGADGAVVKVAQRPNRRSRSAPHSKERFADMNLINRPVCAAKEASRHLLNGAATPPCEGGEYCAQCVSNK